MAEYIERETAMLLPELPKEYRHYQTDNLDDAYEQGWYDALFCLEHIPASDVAPVVHGYWIDNGANGYKWAFICSRCGYVDGHPFDDRHNFCPSCGAIMDGDNNAFD